MKNNNALISSDVKGNAAQMEAILHVDGPAMVLAGPGSGKTFVIVQRLKNLILNAGVDPFSILVITFTKAAAIEMQQRFLKATDNSYPEVCFGTFHSIFYQIIRQSNPNKKLNIATENFKYRIVREIIKDAYAKKLITEDDYNEGYQQISDLISEISRIKNTTGNPEDSLDSIPCKEYFPCIYKSYNKMIEDNDYLDFDDMVLKCHELFCNNPNTLNLWRERFKYILIDEYQDINLLQYKIIKMMTKSANLFVVGDDDQSIYGFRGSDPEIMQKFTDDFKDNEPKIINLNINYRCGKKILYASLPVINQNRLRLQKSLEPFENSIEGYVVPRRYHDKDEQNRAIIKFLSGRKENLNDVAFIFRTNSQALSLANVLKSAGISTNLDNYSRVLTDSPAVKLCISYLNFACIEKKREYFYKIMNKPMRYFSRECAGKDYVTENEILSFYRGNYGKQREVKKFFNQINIISKLRPSLSVRYLRREIGIDKIYQSETDALNDLSEIACKMHDNMELLKFLNEMDEREKENNKVKKSTPGKNCVKLLTMHGSKGLEFDTVWLPGLNEGIIPSRSAVTLSQTEEERRMLYVAMTRAKTALILSYITGNENNPMLPSRFLRPIQDLWNNSQSSPSSGSSIISSNSTSSR